MGKFFACANENNRPTVARLSPQILIQTAPPTLREGPSTLAWLRSSRTDCTLLAEATAARRPSSLAAPARATMALVQLYGSEVSPPEPVRIERSHW